MNSIKIVQIDDAFTDELFSGNPAAVNYETQNSSVHGSASAGFNE